MDVDFNGLRKQTCWAYDDLVKKLNGAIKDDYGTKVIEIDASEIQDIMDNLRGLIMTSAWIYKEGDPDIKTVGDEVGEVSWFNIEEDENR